MKIAIASGKGGTGKTTVSVSLFHFLSVNSEKTVQLIDCDVEEPNDILFFPEPLKTSEKKVFQLIPEIDASKCTFCGKCADWCEFNALTIIGKIGFAEVHNELCHSCGACSVACEYGAISEYEKPLGVISKYKNQSGNEIVEGRLEVGSAMQTPLIKKVKETASSRSEIILFDAPPGTSCPVVETVADADFVILVTEPTPFGLNDLKITVELLKNLTIPFGVIVNKAGLGSDDVYDFLRENKIELLGEIPFTAEYASSYSSGDILTDIPENIGKAYEKIMEKIFKQK